MKRLIGIVLVMILGLGVNLILVQPEKKVIAVNNLQLDAQLIIITKDILQEPLKEYIEFKKEQGFVVKIKTIEEIDKEFSQEEELTDKIRNYLKQEQENNKDKQSFTLLVGSPKDIPLKKISPPPYYSTSPVDYFFYSDFYYADLVSNWDPDGNKKYGEKVEEINFEITNFVGRIPFSEPEIVQKIMKNIVEASKKENSLKSLMAVMQFADPQYLNNWDLAKWAEKGKEILLKDNYQVFTLYEKESKSQSNYTPTAPLNQKNFNKYLLENPDLVVTAAHAGIVREIWKDKNNNNVFENSELIKEEFFTLQDLKTTNARTKIWFDFGCSNALIYWELKQDIWFATSDEILKFNVASTLVGNTSEPPWFIYTEGLEKFLNTIIVQKKPIGEWLKERYNNNKNDIYYLMANIVGDPTFTLFPDQYISLYDITPPNLTLEEIPTKIVNQKLVTLSGLVDDNSKKDAEIQVLVNNKIQYSQQISKAFELILDLEEGLNLIEIKVKDIAGNQTIKKLELICDTIPPEIILSIPKIVNEKSLLLSGLIKDSSEIKDKKVIINNEKVEIDNEFNFSYPLILNEGRNLIIIEAEDIAGNKTIKEIAIICDTIPPEIIMEYLPTVTNEKFFVLKGFIKEEGSGVKQFFLNQKKVLLENLKFSEGIILQPGPNLLVMEVEDEAGNKIVKKVTIKYQIQVILQIGSKTIYINNSPQEIDVAPVIIEGRTLLPIRYIAEPLGANVSWDGGEKKVTVSLNNTLIELWIGKNMAKVNGIDTPIDPNNPKVVPTIISGRTMLPLRFIAENLGCKVDWDGLTKTITITYPKD